jgi:hypothetical protein
LFHDVFDAFRQRLNGFVELTLQFLGAHRVVYIGLDVIHTVSLLHLDLVFHLIRHCRVLV